MCIWHLKTHPKQKGGMCGEIPQMRVAESIYFESLLTVPEQSQNPIILNNFLALQLSSDVQLPKPKVMVKNIITNK